MGRSLPSPIRLSSPEVFRTGGLSIGASGGPFAAFRASIGAGRVGADDGREVDHPPTDALPRWRHILGVGQVLVGHQACLGRGGGLSAVTYFPRFEGLSVT
jgi:hypothetical protein